MQETLNLILEKLTALDNKVTALDNKVTALEEGQVQIRQEMSEMKQQITMLDNKVTALDEKVDRRFDELSRDVAHILANDISSVISEQLNYLRTEVAIIKSAVGEHEIDIKYLKKAIS